MYSSLNEFVFSTPNAKTCVLNISKVLKQHGFIELKEGDNWKKTEKTIKGIYVIREGTIIAVRLPKNLAEFAGVLTHSDSPCFKIKTNPEIVQNGYVKLNVEPYGGAIYYSWLDKPLSICGTIIENNTGISQELDTRDKYQVFIPSQAIHINRDVNTALSLNPQKDMLPVCTLGDSGNFFEKIKEIARCKGSVRAHDLFLYNPEPVKTLNMGKYSIAMGPRLDNLVSVYSALKALILSADEESDSSAKVFVAFNNEEIGSATYEGADGNFLTSVLERICNMYGVEKYRTFSNSYFLSIDAAHAIHPNAPEKSDPTNYVSFGGGVVIKHNTNYASSLDLERRIKALCYKNNIKVQDFYSRSDMRCGSTLGNISMSHHGIKTLDIGIPMLAMHSSVETICLEDMEHLESLLIEYYNMW